MKISIAAINSILNDVDVEGYMKLGSPSDEYLSESKNIYQALIELEKDDYDFEHVKAIIIIEWMQSFNLTEIDILERNESIDSIVNKIINNDV